MSCVDLFSLFRLHLHPLALALSRFKLHALCFIVLKEINQIQPHVIQRFRYIVTESWLVNFEVRSACTGMFRICNMQTSKIYSGVLILKHR